MRVHEELSDEEEAAAAVEPVTLSSPRAAAALLQQGLVVGYALTKKKVKSFLQPKLLALARKKGIHFISIDENRPLSEQGPFNIILHKDYREEHPEVTVLDPPHAIQHLHNRQSMLQEVADLNLSNGYGEVCTPRQLVIMKDPSSIPDAVAKAGLTLPLVAKPLVVDGTSKSHELSLAYVEASLPLLDPPLVLQEFVNHGGILFKVYIVGETIRVVRRFSLPDVNTYDLGNNDGIFRFPRVSCARNNAEDADVDPCIAGYGKMPGYEHIFTDFLLSLMQSKYKRRLSGS
ncbi:hypothetical protein PR202_ga08018 [Eleusine coracana subsp. coracana]|uniref:Inositol-tetrakisphosphate 1-kinase n=1 Tax=Eleusine coracana subsp. coracana TaxID=191504 RepID=A0AAV5C1M9_ELECO|nr:hypothetical protein PR202_ga08018 [Eleusine coracana subsp. coracana]